MRVSCDWLKEYTDIKDDARAVASRLTHVGFALEGIEPGDADTVLDLDVPTNRPDCLSHLGVAREISAIYGSDLRRPKFELREGEKEAARVFSISIIDSDLCARYCGRYVAGVKIGPSPDWLKARLEALGQRSINNVADVTNYVMLELGQPLHAFDADTLSGHQIIVRRAEIDERMTTLDGVERLLNPSMLLIADADRGVALAGVMGGAETEISPSTTNVLLESANFDPMSIRKTSRSLGLMSEASYRFERGCDVEMARYACDRAAALIQLVAGGEIYRGVIDVYPRQTTRKPLVLRRARIQAFLGAAVDDGIVERIFKRLEFKIAAAPEGWTIEAPSHRVDINFEEDLLEEIARHHGYDKFPMTLPKWNGFGSGLPHEGDERRLRSILSGLGYTEIYTYSFSDEEMERRFRPAIEPVRLQNPMTEDASVMRTSLVPSVIKAIQWNLNRGTRDLQLYELSKVYSKDGERRSLIVAATGALRPAGVHEREHPFDFYDMKGAVEQLLHDFDASSDVTAQGVPAYYHPGRAARVGELGAFGELHPEYAGVFKLRPRVYLAEIDVEKLLAMESRKQVQPLPRFPAIRRDFSLLLEKGTQYVAVHQTIRDAGIPELVRVEPFDRMETGSFPDTKYSLSISVVYQSSERTLTDAEVEGFDQRILRVLEERLGAHLRR
jgi:phenylalanyl-tRNA synthetase beta chain